MSLTAQRALLISDANRRRIEYATQYTLTSNPERSGALATLANQVANYLGHIALRCNASVECSRCGMCGYVGVTLTGGVFALPCGAVVGLPKTEIEIAARIGHLQSLITELTISTRPGHQRESVAPIVAEHTTEIRKLRQSLKALVAIPGAV